MQYGDVIMSAMVSQFPRLAIVYSAVYSGADQRKHKSSASLAFVRGIHRWPVDRWIPPLPHTGPVTREMFPFDDVIMIEWKFGLSFRLKINKTRNFILTQCILTIYNPTIYNLCNYLACDYLSMLIYCSKRAHGVKLTEIGLKRIWCKAWINNNILRKEWIKY